MAYENSHPTFFIPDNHCGPDIIFFVKFEKVTVPVFVQIKLRYSLHTIAGALSTIRPELFYQNKNGVIFDEKSNKPIINKIRQRCEKCGGSIGLLIAYPADLCQGSFVTNNHSYDLRNRPEQKQLIGIIDYKNASKIFQGDHLKFLDALKSTMKKRKSNMEDFEEKEDEVRSEIASRTSSGEGSKSRSKKPSVN